MRLNAFSSVAALLLAITSASCSANKSCGTCIEDSEVLQISQRWLNVFATSGPGGVETLSSAVTEDVHLSLLTINVTALAWTRSSIFIVPTDVVDTLDLCLRTKRQQHSCSICDEL